MQSNLADLVALANAKAGFENVRAFLKPVDLSKESNRNFDLNEAEFGYLANIGFVVKVKNEATTIGNPWDLLNKLYVFINDEKHTNLVPTLLSSQANQVSYFLLNVPYPIEIDDLVTISGNLFDGITSEVYDDLEAVFISGHATLLTIQKP